MDYPSTTEIWEQGRDSVNLVTGAILGAYLGLSISKQGLADGTQFDLFALLTFAAYSAGAIISCGNRWFFGNKRISLFFGLSAILPIWMSVSAASRLGLDSRVFLTIYASWVSLVGAQIIAFEVAEKMKKSKK